MIFQKVLFSWSVTYINSTNSYYDTEMDQSITYRHQKKFNLVGREDIWLWKDKYKYKYITKYVMSIIWEVKGGQGHQRLTNDNLRERDRDGVRAFGRGRSLPKSWSIVHMLRYREELWPRKVVIQQDGCSLGVGWGKQLLKCWRFLF